MVIWKQSKRFKADRELKKATLFTMLLASNESTRNVTQMIFLWMELILVNYHHVIPPEESGSSTLGELFKKEFRQHDNSFTTYNEKLFMAHITKYLEGYKWKDVKEWQDVSSQFLLARSFSFFRHPDPVPSKVPPPTPITEARKTPE